MVHDLLETAALFAFDARWLRTSLRSITIMCMCTSTVASAQAHRQAERSARSRQTRRPGRASVHTDDPPQRSKTGRTAGPFKPQQSKITWSSVLRGNAGGESNFHASVNSL